MDMFSGKKILIAGTGKSGRAAGSFLQSKNASLFYYDDHPQSFKTISNKEVSDQDFDYLIVSPGFPPTHRVVEKFREKNLPILGEMELAFLIMDKKAIGVTGTNGKTTVVTHVTDILCAHQIKARALGNIGTPLIEEVSNSSSDVFVIEMSSFQLETMQTPKLHSGCILNITPDHLDRYHSMDDYARAKGGICHAIHPKGRLYVESLTLEKWKPFFCHENLISYGFTNKCGVSLIGNKINRFGLEECTLCESVMSKPIHDLENFLATYALLRDMDLEAEEIIDSFLSLKKPPHRIEFICELKGVSFFDDSKGTNIDAVIKAVTSMKGPVHLIAGGVDKGSSYSPWIPYFEGKVAKIFLIGQAKERIQKELSDTIPLELFDSLEAATEAAYRFAKTGDTILLSPGCSSFDMFRDYKHRGEEFKKIVSNL